MDIFLDIGESFFIYRLIKFLQVRAYRLGCLDIRESGDRLRRQSIFSDTYTLESWKCICIGRDIVYGGTFELLEGSHDIREEIFTPSLIDEIFGISREEYIFIEIIWVYAVAFIVSIIVKYSWGYTRRSELSGFCIEIMRFIEERGYLRDISARLPESSE
jgi:hypothetical protein